MSGLVFLSRFLCLRVWVDDVFCCFSSSSLFFFEEIELSANRTPHTPPHVLLFFFLFLSPPLCLVRLFWPCVLFVLGFLRGAILGPARFLDSLGTFLRPFFGREAVEAFALFFLWSVVFPVLRRHTFLDARLGTRCRRGRDSRWSRLRPGEVPPRYRALLARNDCLLGRLLRRSWALTRTFCFPQVSLFFFSLSLSLLAKTLVHKVLREYPADWRLSAY